MEIYSKQHNFPTVRARELKLLLAATCSLTRPCRVNLSGSKLTPEQADSLLSGFDTAVLREVD